MFWEKSNSCLNQDDAVHRGIFLPKHMIPPGQDGYRTPTIEDYEHQIAHSARDEHIRGGKSSGSSRTRLPVLHSGIFGKHRNLSRLNVSHRIEEKLQWRERIRHFTWTFFTVTMATGGIANVIYSGKIPKPCWQVDGS